VDPADCAAAQAAGELAPSSLAEVGLVHLSTEAQVVLPTDRIFRGCDDVLLLAVDAAVQDRAGIEVRWEPGVPPTRRTCARHAYGAVPVAAVIAVLDHRPRPDGAVAPPPTPSTRPAPAAGTR
jgi:uncharacterized protein (DUF952 family)